MAGKRSLERKKRTGKSISKSGRKPRNLPAGNEHGDLPPIKAEKPVEGGGSLQMFRSGFKRSLGSKDGPKSVFDWVIDIGLWILAAGALYMVLKRWEII